MKKHRHFKDLFDLSGRVALVTGATRGLGKTMALTLAQAGARVAMCSRDEKEARTAASDIARSTGQGTLGMAADVSRKADVDQMVALVEKDLGSIDILVASAGINIRKEITELTEDDWDQVLNINLKGSFLVAQAVLPGMCSRKWGRIVFIGSILSFVSIPGRAAYASSKAALLGLTRTLALETAAYGVCVNSICPGPFKTPMNLSILQDEEKNRAFLKKLPIGRWGDPGELRGLVLYLSSPACSFMTGSNIVIDGGWTAQ